MPFGNNCFSLKNKKAINFGCEFFSKNNISIYKRDFQDLIFNETLNKDDFVYLDSPYSITTATYNESYKWGFNDDNRLFMVCKELDKSNIKFGMSNVIINKGLENKNLIDFVLRMILRYIVLIIFNIMLVVRKTTNNKKYIFAIMK
ncbi:Modification methylase FokI [Campylobacter coli]|nr:Modification methylase FokI [Campylobacter coli]